MKSTQLSTVIISVYINKYLRFATCFVEALILYQQFWCENNIRVDISNFIWKPQNSSLSISLWVTLCIFIAKANLKLLYLNTRFWYPLHFFVKYIRYKNSSYCCLHIKILHTRTVLQHGGKSKMAIDFNSWVYV